MKSLLFVTLAVLACIALAEEAAQTNVVFAPTPSSLSAASTCNLNCAILVNPCAVPTSCCCRRGFVAPEIANPVVPELKDRPCPVSCVGIANPCGNPETRCCCNAQKGSFVRPVLHARDPNAPRYDIVQRPALVEEKEDAKVDCSLVVNACSIPNHVCCVQRQPVVAHAHPPQPALPFRSTEAQQNAAAAAAGCVTGNCQNVAVVAVQQPVTHVTAPQPALPFRSSEKAITVSRVSCPYVCAQVVNPCSVPNHCCCAASLLEAEAKKEQEQEQEQAPKVEESLVETTEEQCPFQCATLTITCSTNVNHCCCRQQYIAPEYKPVQKTCTVAVCPTRICTVASSCPNQVTTLTVTQASSFPVRPSYIELDEEMH